MLFPSESQASRRVVRMGIRATALRFLSIVATASVVTGGVSAGALADERAAPTQSDASFVTFVDKCFDVRGGSTGNSANLIQYTCSGAANQKFDIVPTSDGRVEIRTFAGKCLDVRGASTSNSTEIIQYTCSGAVNQKFWVDSIGNNQVRIRTFADKCLDVQGGSGGNSAKIIQYSCTGDYNQRFMIR
jgi:hypothetical protein